MQIKLGISMKYTNNNEINIRVQDAADRIEIE